MKPRTIQLTLTLEEFAFIDNALLDAVWNKRYKPHRKGACEKAMKQIEKQIFSSDSIQTPKKCRIIKRR